MSYVYRYAGMLEQAASECNTAVALDPGNYTFRSCAWTFAESAKRIAPPILFASMPDRNGPLTPCPRYSARRKSSGGARGRESMPSTPRYHRDLLEACLRLRPASELDRIAHDAETNLPTDPDPETWYYEGAILAYCGKKQAALHMLESAVEQNYCAYSNLLADPLLAKLRTDTAFDKVLTDAAACQEAVRASANPPSH